MNGNKHVQTCVGLKCRDPDFER